MDRMLGEKRRRILARLVLRQRNRCALCDREFTAAHPPTRDHIIPRSWGGSGHQTNLQAAHGWCNFVRGARMTIPEFRELLNAGALKPPRSFPTA